MMGGERWDIFCRVIDNFGDIGVCWRLARQLAAEHGLCVRLWVDDIASFRKLCPAFDADSTDQTHEGVVVRQWHIPFVFDGDVADAVIEAFACELPEKYLAAMAARPTPPVWINLEYLSAEDWVAGCHGLASPHPRLPLRKYFFFPGFDARTGGLLRETDLIERHRRWRADAAASRAYFGLPPAGRGEILISLFCYENANLPALLDAWCTAKQPLRCLVPEGLALRQAADWLGQPELTVGTQQQRGHLTLHALPFSSQPDYDRLLSLCNLNFVRGEDSFVRAQWAGRPLVWQIYPQAEHAHLPKLTAFLDHYCATLSPPAADACRCFWQAWNGAADLTAAQAWPAFQAHLPTLQQHATTWSEALARQGELGEKLVHFCKTLI